MKVKDLKKFIKSKLLSFGIDEFEAENEAKICISEIVKKPMGEIFFAMENDAMPLQIFRAKNILGQRKTGLPLSKILGKKFFYKNEFLTSVDVLDPRNDTEILVEKAIEFLQSRPTSSVLDLGTGSGCIVISLLDEIKYCEGIAVEKSKKAVSLAIKNSKKIGTEKNLKIINNSFEDLSFLKGEKFDCIVSNPPYIRDDEFENLQDEVKKFDPKMALISGMSGLECYEIIAREISKNNLLKNDGKIFLEIGVGQEKDIAEIFSNNGFKLEQKIKDLNKIIRILQFVNT